MPSAGIPGKRPEAPPTVPEVRLRHFRHAHRPQRGLCRSSRRRSLLFLGGSRPVAQGTGSRQFPRPGVHSHLLRAGRADESGGAAAGGESRHAARPRAPLPEPSCRASGSHCPSCPRSRPPPRPRRVVEAVAVEHEASGPVPGRSGRPAEGAVVAHASGRRGSTAPRARLACPARSPLRFRAFPLPGRALASRRARVPSLRVFLRDPAPCPPQPLSPGPFIRPPAAGTRP
uniref:Uncharacterized protein n=1 Tax=Rangifer tarandus platyrhynchus TaxID=3082113 RepID=A0ACB0E663_RANTA|nr:unnamed protein product [Rangifer tarandus platyrhynchus]